MYQDRRREKPTESAVQARKRVGELLDVNAGTLRGWIERAEVDAGDRPGVASATEARMKELEREVAELRRANEVLKTATPEGWLFVEPVSPSTDCESYTNATFGDGPGGRRDLHRIRPRQITGLSAHVPRRRRTNECRPETPRPRRARWRRHRRYHDLAGTHLRGKNRRFRAT
jgi:hypothetical protein